MKVKPLEHAAALKRTNGIEKAMKIADSCIRGSSKENRQGVPYGTVFYKKDRRGSEAVDVAYLDKLNNFWTEVFYILKKQVKK